MAEAGALPDLQQQPQQERQCSSSAAADIVQLSRVAFRETMVELSAATRQTRAMASSALRGLMLGAEAQLGIEVSIEDPAQRELFGYLIQVEALLGQVRSEAAALLRGAQVFSEGIPAAGSAAAAAIAGSPRTPAGVRGGAEVTSLADGLNTLAEVVRLDSTRVASSSSAVGDGGAAAAASSASEGPVPGTAEARDAAWHTMSLSPNAGDRGSVRYYVERRLEREVLVPADLRLGEFAQLRERIRERQRRHQDLEECLHEVAALHKSQRSLASTVGGALVGGLRPLMSASPARVGTAEERLKKLQVSVAEIDEEILTRLLDVQEHAGRAVAELWAALARVRIGFFASLAEHWGPVATSLAHGEDLYPRLQPKLGTVISGASGTSPAATADGEGSPWPASRDEESDISALSPPAVPRAPHPSAADLSAVEAAGAAATGAAPSAAAAAAAVAEASGAAAASAAGGVGGGAACGGSPSHDVDLDAVAAAAAALPKEEVGFEGAGCAESPTEVPMAPHPSVVEPTGGLGSRGALDFAAFAGALPAFRQEGEPDFDALGSGALSPAAADDHLPMAPAPSAAGSPPASAGAGGPVDLAAVAAALPGARREDSPGASFAAFSGPGTPMSTPGAGGAPAPEMSQDAKISDRSLSGAFPSGSLDASPPAGPPPPHSSMADLGEGGLASPSHAVNLEEAAKAAGALLPSVFEESVAVPDTIPEASPCAAPPAGPPAPHPSMADLLGEGGGGPSSPSHDVDLAAAATAAAGLLPVVFEESVAVSDSLPEASPSISTPAGPPPPHSSVADLLGEGGNGPSSPSHAVDLAAAATAAAGLLPSVFEESVAVSNSPPEASPSASPPTGLPPHSSIDDLLGDSCSGPASPSLDPATAATAAASLLPVVSEDSPTAPDSTLGTSPAAGPPPPHPSMEDLLGGSGINSPSHSVDLGAAATAALTASPPGEAEERQAADGAEEPPDLM